MARKFVPQLSAQSSADESVVGSEIELLTNIYDCNELVVKEINGIVTLNVHITPRTADDIDQQFVYINVTMELSKDYPLLPPVTKVTSSRGLSDAHISSINTDVQLMAEEKLGGPMVFDLLEHVRDCLTDQNKPCGSCSICLCMFEEEDSFTRTECYHYFHVSCFAHYVHHLECDDDKVDDIPGQPQVASAQSNCVKCPVCRISLSDNSSCFQAIKDVNIVVNNSDDQDMIYYHPSEADIQRMKEWECLKERQKSRGGIIDHSTDPHLVDWDWTPSTSVATTRENVVTIPVTMTTETTVSTGAVPECTATHSRTHDYHHPRTQHYNYYHKKTKHKHY